MKTNLFIENSKPYKANLHCHSTISDGDLTIEQLKNEYMKMGYSIIAFTDHDKYVDHSDLTDKNFLAIASYEADISDNIIPDDHTRRCYHLNCYDKNPNKNKTTIEPRPNYRDIDAINKYIEELRKNDFLVCYNHANWSLQTPDDYKNLKGLFACEIFNYSAYLDGIDGNHENVYDCFLKDGNKMFCIASDDNHDRFPIGHPMNDSFGGFTVIMAKQLDYQSVIEALEAGSFYASMGPRIDTLYIEDNKLHIQCSPARRIAMTTDGRHASCIMATKDNPITHAELEIEDRYKYIRVQIEDFDGKRANTNAWFLD